jgi:DNA repair exonuclease SbcCD ATPase subunit
MTAETKSDYLLDKISERLGVPKPVEGFAFAPDPLGLLTNLVALLADPPAAKKRVSEFNDAAAKADAATAAAKQALADREVALADLAAARQKHAETLASELAAHTVEMERRTRELNSREQATAAREKEADDLVIELEAERADLKRRLAAIRSAAA